MKLLPFRTSHTYPPIRPCTPFRLRNKYFLLFPPFWDREIGGASVFICDLEGRPLSWTPNLGGLAFAIDEPDGNPIAGVRINPPPTDSHIFLRDLRTWWADIFLFHFPVGPSDWPGSMPASRTPSTDCPSSDGSGLHPPTWALAISSAQGAMR